MYVCSCQGYNDGWTLSFINQNKDYIFIDAPNNIMSDMDQGIKKPTEYIYRKNIGIKNVAFVKLLH